MRARVYHSCVVTDIDEGENVNIGTMTLPKTLTIQYPLSGDTKVVTSEGTKNLRDLADTEQKLLGLDGQWTLGTVKSFGVQPLLKVTTVRGTQTKDVFATAEHRWIFPDQTESITVELVPGQKLLTADGPEWTVKSVELTSRVEEVFCASVPEGHAFVLEDDLVTGNCYSTPV
jgi:DNA primase